MASLQSASNDEIISKVTAANHVILLDPWWNPSIKEHAIDRAYRIGQTQDVTVIGMLGANTIE